VTYLSIDRPICKAWDWRYKHNDKRKKKKREKNLDWLGQSLDHVLLQCCRAPITFANYYY